MCVTHNRVKKNPSYPSVRLIIWLSAWICRVFQQTKNYVILTACSWCLMLTGKSRGDEKRTSGNEDAHHEGIHGGE